MKKVLFASTALMAFAGAASAEITMKGWAEMGVIGGDRYGAGGVPLATQFWNDVDVEFTLSGESDSGLSFGARVDLDEAGNLGSEYRNQGTFMWVKGSFGTVTLGDTDGALDWAMQEANIGSPGSLTDDETTHAGFAQDYGDGGGYFGSAARVGGASNFDTYDNQVLRYEYTTGAFGVAVSYEQAGELGGGVVADTATNYDGSLAIGLKYALDLGGTKVNLAAGYQTIDWGAGWANEKIAGVSASASFGGGFSAGIQYAQYSDVWGVSGMDVNHVGLGLTYKSGPITVHGNWGEFDTNFGEDTSGWVVIGQYDLGGGLAVNASVANSDRTAIAGGTDDTYWSLGMRMSF